MFCLNRELVGEDNSTVGVLLIDNTGTEEICVNMDLIRLGVAELDPAHAHMDKQGIEIQSTLDIMKSKIISNFRYLKGNWTQKIIL